MQNETSVSPPWTEKFWPHIDVWRTEELYTMNLDSLGWNTYFKAQFEPYKSLGFVPARIFNEQKNLYQIYLLGIYDEVGNE